MTHRPFRVAVVCLLLAGLPVLAQTTTNTMVRVNTVRGPVDIELLDTQAPQTVANFLNYVRRGAYDSSFFHRLVPGFVVQGGGYSTPAITKIPTDPPVINEFSATRSNLRGTVAMAKVGGNPNSATSEWFVNLADNSGPCGPGTTNGGLDCQNEGFTVFGRVTAPGMVAMDQIAAQGRVNASTCTGTPFSIFRELPINTSITLCAQIAANLVVVSSARELPARDTLGDSDRIFNYLEAAYPQYAAPASAPSATALGYYHRFYSKIGAYAGTKDGDVFYLLPENNGVPQRLGSIAEWLAIAAAAGY